VGEDNGRHNRCSTGGPPDWLFVDDRPALPEGWTLSADLDGSSLTYTQALVVVQDVALTDRVAVSGRRATLSPPKG
jgi:hypothetical protein